MSMLLDGENSSLLCFGSRDNWWMGQECCRCLWDDTFAVWALKAGWVVCRGRGRTWRAGLGREDQRRFPWKKWWPRGKNIRLSTHPPPSVHLSLLLLCAGSGLEVKPPPTGSGSSVPSSSARCWGSSFGDLLESRPPWGCLCRAHANTQTHTSAKISAKHVVLLHQPPSPGQNKHSMSAQN